MGLEATWNLVDIPTDARDAAQAAASREGLTVGEWLNRRILRKFSELNLREQEDAVVSLRNHVAELAERFDRFEGQSQTEPMREALKKLHQGLTRLNDELVRSAGHSAIQISQLSTTLEALSGRVDELRNHDVDSRGAFERRMVQLQEFVDGMNLRQAAETRAISSRMDSLGGTLAESRRLIASDGNAIERLEENLAKTESRYGDAFRALHGEFNSFSERVDRAGRAASESSAALDQRIASMHLEFANVDARRDEEKQLMVGKIDKLHTKIDDIQTDVTGMCGALDRRVLLSQQALQSLDSRHVEMSHSLTRSMESVAAQLETVQSEAVRVAANLETRVARLEISAEQPAAAEAATEGRFAAIEHQLSELATRTSASESAVSAMLPTAEGIETRLKQLNLKLETEAARQQNAVEQLKAGLIEQTLSALGEKLDAEGKKQQAAITELKNGLLDQLSQAFDERAGAEERKQQSAIAQLQSTFTSALHALGETFESEARKQQEAIAELKASLAAPQPVSEQAQAHATSAAHLEILGAGPAPDHTDPVAARTDDSKTEHEDESTAAWAAGPQEEPVLVLSTVAHEPDVQIASANEHVESTIPVDPPPFAAPEQRAHSANEPLSIGGSQELAPALAMARSNIAEVPEAPSYLSAARQSLQSAAVRNEAPSTGKDIPGFGFLKSLALPRKQKGQKTSYALLAGIALVAVLAIIVGATELVHRGEPTNSMRTYPRAASLAKHAPISRHADAKKPASASPAPNNVNRDRTVALANSADGQVQLLMGVRALARSNNVEGAKWLARAAAQGVPVAQYRLATLYASGRGLPADKVKAFEWYLAAARAGNRKAMSNLAVAYAQGEGTAKNPQEAGRWFLKAAQLGLADAQFDLAILYERGLGVPQNLTDAFRWYVIAAKSGDKESKDRVEALSSQLTAEDRAAAELAASEFKPLPVNQRANEPL